MKLVTDKNVIAQLEGGQTSERKPVTDPTILAQLEGKEGVAEQSPSLLKRAGKAIKDAGSKLKTDAEYLANQATTFGSMVTLPFNAVGSVAGELVDSIANQHMPTVEGIAKRMETGSNLTNKAVYQPSNKEGQQMVEDTFKAMTAIPQGVDYIDQRTGNHLISNPNLYGAVQATGELAPWLLLGKAGHKAGTTGRALEQFRTKGNEQPGIGFNTFEGQVADHPVISQGMRDARNPLDQHARVMSDLQAKANKQRTPTRPVETQPDLLSVDPNVAPDVTIPQRNAELAQGKIDREIAVREALAKDDVAMANEMAIGRENPLVTNVLGERSRKLQDLEQQQPGIFNHDVPDGIPAEANLSVDPAIKPVIKATPKEFADMRVNEQVSPTTHVSFFPFGVGADKPVYIISKAGAEARGKTIEQIKQELVNGQGESDLLGYPERSPNPVENKTAAVTKAGEVLTNPEEIMQAQTQGELKWASEGKPEEVLAKAQEVATPREEVAKPITENGSGESAASLEAQSRLKSQKNSKFYSITKSGRITELPATVDRVDIPAPKGGGIFEVKDGIASRVDGELSLNPKTEADLLSKEPNTKDNFADFKETKRSGYKGSTTIQAQRLIYALKKAGIPRSDFSVKTKMLKQGEYGDAHVSFKGASQKLIRNKAEGLLDAGFDIRMDVWDDGTTYLSIDQPKFEGRGKVVVNKYTAKVFGEGRPDSFTKLVPEKVGEYDSIPSQEIKTPQIEAQAQETASLKPNPPDVSTELLNEAGTKTPEENIVDFHLGVDPAVAADSFVKALGTSFKDRTSYAVRNFFRSFLNPQFLAENSPSIKKLYDLMSLRRESRNSILYDLFQVGLDTGSTLIKSMDKAELKDLSELINKSDVYKIKFPEEQLLGDNHFLGKPLSPKVIEAYKLFREQIEANIKREALERRELAINQFETRPWYDDLRKMFIDKDEFGNPLLDLEENPHYLEDSGLAFNEQFQRDLTKLQERIKQIDEIEQAHLETSFYAPRVRDFGDWAVRAYHVVNGEVRKDLDVFMQMAKTPGQARKLLEKVKANPDKYFPINYREAIAKDPNSQFYFDIQETKHLPEDLYLYAGKPTATASKIKFALERALDDGKIDPQLYDDIFKEVMDSYEEATLMRGYGRHSIHRNERLIEGYKTDNYFSLLKDQTSAMAGSLSKAKFMMESLKLMVDAPAEFKPIMQDMITNALRNRNTTAEGWSSTARSLLTMYHLGARTVSIMANMTQNMSMGAAEMNLRLRRDFGLKSTADVDIPIAQFDIIRGKVTEAERAFLDWFDRVGADQAQFVNEISGRGERSASGLVNTVTGKAMWAFGKIESKFNREALGLAMYRRLTKSGIREEIARETAKETSNIAHADMSPENLPLMAQGKIEVLARPALALRRYNMHMINYLFNRSMQAEFRPVARMITVQAAIGGLKAVPLFLAVNELLERKYGKSLLLDIKKAVYKTMEDQDKTMAQVIDGVVERGLPSLVGIDLSNSLSLNIPFMFEEGDNTLGNNLGGVLASDIQNLGRSVDKISRGQVKEGLIQASPMAVRDIGKAVLGYTEGFTDKNGRPLKDSSGKPIKLSGKEAVLQGLGVTSSRVGNVRDMRSSEYRLETYYRNELEKYNSRIQNSKGESPAERAEVRAERKRFIKEFQKKYPNLVKGNLLYNPASKDRRTDQRLKFERGF